MTRIKGSLFSALLRHWRGRRGLSQLDLALAAEISARHLSFLETGRAEPSRDMVLRLALTLDVPLRDQNSMLEAAGFDPEFPEPNFEDGLPEPVSNAIGRMMDQHEPFPLVAMNRHYDALCTNRGAVRMLSRFIADPSAVTGPPNLLRLVFDPRLARPFVVEWERVARSMLSRAHREALARPDDVALRDLVSELLRYPDVPPDFRQPDFSAASEPLLSFRVARGDLALAFMTTMTVFNAPQNVTLEEVRIESYFPLDRETESACRRLEEEEGEARAE